MSIRDIRESDNLAQAFLKNEKAAAQRYACEHPDSLLSRFIEELHSLGFVFETSNQALGLMPKYKATVLPIALSYYQLAKEEKQINEQNYFLGFFHFKGLTEVVPMLLNDFNAGETADSTRWFLADCLYQIRSKEYIDRYIEIASNYAFGINRQMIVLLLGKLKAEKAIPLLISLLEDKEVCLQAISALGEFKRVEFRCYFERFQDSPHPGWRKYARIALKKLDN